MQDPDTHKEQRCCGKVIQWVSKGLGSSEVGRPLTGLSTSWPRGTHMTIGVPKNLCSERSSGRKTRNRCLYARITFRTPSVRSKVEGQDFRMGVIGFIPSDHDDQRRLRTGIGAAACIRRDPDKNALVVHSFLPAVRITLGRRPLDGDRSRTLWHPRRKKKGNPTCLYDV
jgi:hypothetical protein